MAIPIVVDDMETKNQFEFCAKLIDDLVSKNCLCSVNDVQNVLEHMFHYSFKILDANLVKKFYECEEISCQMPEDNLINQMMCMSFVKKIGDAFNYAASQQQPVCNKVYCMLNQIASNSSWEVFVENLQTVKDMHLQWMFIKSMCSILYSSTDIVFKTRVQDMLKILNNNLFNEHLLPILQLVTSLLGYNVSCEESKSPGVCCEKYTVYSIVPCQELFNILCEQICLDWRSFLTEFKFQISCPDKCLKKNMTEFLILWKTLSKKSMCQKFISTFFNEDIILIFFTSAYNLPLHSLRFYLDITMHVFNLDLQFKINFPLIETNLEKVILLAIERDFLHLFPASNEESFISGNELEMMPYNLPSGKKKCGFVMKKISCIFLMVLSESQNIPLICNVFPALISSLKSNSSLSNNSKWPTILDIFIEDDDLLFNVMLANLKVYVLFEDFKRKSMDATYMPAVMMLIENYLNPHNMFIELLQRLGYDHNELLAFLTSDETCFLLYFVQYLKVLTNEQQVFYSAHQNIMKSKEYQDLLSENRTVGNSSCYGTEKSLNISLVSYASSSSSDDDSGDSSIKSNILNKFVGKSVLVFKNLRIALMKLAEKKEFPYNVSPLIKLLLICETY